MQAFRKLFPPSHPPDAGSFQKDSEQKTGSTDCNETLAGIEIFVACFEAFGESGPKTYGGAGGDIPQKMRDAVVVCGFWGNGVGGFSDKIVVPPFVWMEYDMRESRHLYAQVGSSPLLFGTTMEVGGSVR